VSERRHVRVYRNGVLLVMRKPPKPINEMSDDELRAFARSLGEAMVRAFVKEPERRS
jgi:hypothetical protein